jgi:hypothetical protein
MAVRLMGIDRPYQYFHRPEGGKGWWVAATRDEWLQALLNRQSSPKPPNSWIDIQEAEGRTRQQAAIVWGKHYDLPRKYAIWDQATDQDFREAGYLD